MSILNDTLQLATSGLNVADAGPAVLRAATGAFFAISGYHKLFNPTRHAHIASTMVNDKVPFPKFMEWWVPGWEFAGGLMLTAGLFSAFNAVVLTIICIVACCCEGYKRVEAYHPIDLADRADDWLYLQEFLYIIMLAVTIVSGPGKFSLDHLFF